MTFLQKAGNVLLNALKSIVPMIGDSRSEWIRKLAFLLALTVFLCSGYYLIDEVWLQPRYTQEVTHSLRDLYENGEEDSGLTDPDAETPIEFPEGMDPSFEPLYRRNQDVVAWLTFTADGNGTGEDLFGGAIDNPVVQRDKEYYLYRNFFGKDDKAGTLFMDHRNDISTVSTQRNTIIYGHNLNSKLMFSRFNLLVSGKVERARMMSTLTLETLYGEKETYKVFAVMVLDNEAKGTDYFDYIRTNFPTDETFELFINKIQQRSLYTFGDVDVLPSDQLLTLSTCSNKRDTTLKDGRTVIVARRVRDDEEAVVDTSKTVLNETVLMPKAWYVNKGLEIPKEYQ